MLNFINRHILHNQNVTDKQFLCKVYNQNQSQQKISPINITYSNASIQIPIRWISAKKMQPHLPRPLPCTLV